MKNGNDKNGKKAAPTLPEVEIIMDTNAVSEQILLATSELIDHLGHSRRARIVFPDQVLRETTGHLTPELFRECKPPRDRSEKTSAASLRKFLAKHQDRVLFPDGDNKNGVTKRVNDALMTIMNGILGNSHGFTTINEKTISHVRLIQKAREKCEALGITADFPQQGNIKTLQAFYKTSDFKNIARDDQNVKAAVKDAGEYAILDYLKAPDHSKDTVFIVVSDDVGARKEIRTLQTATGKNCYAVSKEGYGQVLGTLLARDNLHYRFGSREAARAYNVDTKEQTWASRAYNKIAPSSSPVGR